MDLQTLIQAGVVAGVVVTPLVTEVLKSKFVPVPAKKFPRTTAFLVSVAVSGYYVWNHFGQTSPLDHWQGWLQLGALTLVTAAVTYNHLLKTGRQS